MEPIISQWFFYFAEFCERVMPIAWGVGIFSGVALIITSIIYQCAMADGGKDAESVAMIQAVSPFVRVLSVVTPIAILLALFLPSEVTLWKMLAADRITPNAISKVVDGGKIVKDDIKQDIIDIIRGVGEEVDIKNDGVRNGGKNKN